LYLSTLMVPQVRHARPLYTLHGADRAAQHFWGLVRRGFFGSPTRSLLRAVLLAASPGLIDAARWTAPGRRRAVALVVPMSRPILATLTIITVVSHWNNFLWPLIITTGPTVQVLTVATANLQSQFNGTGRCDAGDDGGDGPLSCFPGVPAHVVRSISLTDKNE